MQVCEEIRLNVLGLLSNPSMYDEEEASDELLMEQINTNCCMINLMCCWCCDKEYKVKSLNMPHIQFRWNRPQIYDINRFLKKHYFFAFLILVTLCALIFIHPCIPYIYRNFNLNSSLTAKRPWYVKSIELSYIYVSLFYYTIFIFMIIRSLIYHATLYNKLCYLMSNLGSKKYRALKSSATHFNLKSPFTLAYFICIIKTSQSTINKDQRFILTMGFAFLIDATLVITLIIKSFVFRGFGLLTIFSLIDIVTLSTFIILFLFIVIRINRIFMNDFIQVFKDMRSDASGDTLLTPCVMTESDEHSTLTCVTSEQAVTSFDKSNTPEVTSDYLSYIIDDLEESKKEYAIKLFRLVID
jgi:hypothetical protein